MHRPTSSRSPATEPDVVALLDWCARPRRRGDPVRRRLVGGRRRRVPTSATAIAGACQHRPDRASTGCSRSTRVSRAARIQAGALGPALEDQLRPHGFTLRHFPQSFEFSTLGGWLATRSGGHYATVLHAHRRPRRVDARGHARRASSESRRLPGSGAGPSPDRLFLGSEGIARRHHRGVDARAGPPAVPGVGRRSRFADFDAAVDATRAIAQSGLFPTNCRLLDPAEALLTRRRRPTATRCCVLGVRVGRPSGRRVDRPRRRAAPRPRRRRPDGAIPERDDSQADGTRRRRRAPGGTRSCARRTHATRSSASAMIVETFETACTWDRVPGAARGRHRRRARRRARTGLRRRRGHLPLHPRLPRRPGAVLQRLRARPPGRGARRSGTRSRPRRPTRCIAARRHDHPPPRRRPRPPAVVRPAAPRALRRTRCAPPRRALDPAGILNPGVLVDPAS